MGNFEKLSVLVIVVIIVMILVVALYTWSDNPGEEPPAAREVTDTTGVEPAPEAAADNRAKSVLDEWEEAFREKNEADGESLRGGDTEEPVVVDAPTPEPAVTPTPEPKDEPAPAQEEWMYTVKAGDTLTEISERELGTWKRYKEILKLNPDVKAETIREGNTLKMPPRGTGSSTKVDALPGKAAPGKAAPGRAAPAHAGGAIVAGDWYVIRSGDRLERISKRAYGTVDRWPELWARNLSVIDDPDEPPVGARIFIPK